MGDGAAPEQPSAADAWTRARLDRVIADLGRCRGELDSLGLHAPAADVDLAIVRCRARGARA